MGVEVNYGGLEALAAAADKQEQYLTKVHSFVTGNCANFGAFTGFLSVFGGTYRSAYRDAEESLGKAPGAAAGTASRFRTTAANYTARDITASQRLGGIDTKVDYKGLPMVGPAGPMGTPTDDGPVVSRGDKNAAGATGIVSDVATEAENVGYEPTHRWDDGRKSLNPLAPIALAAEVESGVKTTQDAMSAEEDAADYRDFEQGGKGQ